MIESNDVSARRDLLDCFQVALQAVNGRTCVAASLGQHVDLLQNGCALVAIGKAALAMTEGARDVLGTHIQSGLVITKEGYAQPLVPPAAAMEILESAHPVPDERSLLAGQRLIDFVQTLPAHLPMLFLISGGASSLVEHLPDGIGLADLQRINSVMLASGMPIGAINQVRKKLSLLKGGGLLDYLGERPVVNLLMSDVPDNDPAVIGSGLLIRTESPVSLPMDLPDEIVSKLSSIKMPHPVYSRHQPKVMTSIVADNQLACQAAVRCATGKGYRVQLQTACLSGDVERVAEQITATLFKSEAGVYIWGGEPTVNLPAVPGRGGRNQQLALLLAERIQNEKGLQILVAATDGSDGPTEHAGGLVDGQTISRGEQEGMDARRCLRETNAGAFLEASGDLISTGPTGSNVMDLVIACKT